MIDLPPKTTTRLAERYLVSNTPAYLLQHFRDDPAVQLLAIDYTPQELVAEVTRIDQQEERTITDAATAYAAVVALTFQDALGVLQALKDVEIRNLEWIGRILAIWNESRVPISVSSIDVPYKPEIDRGRTRADAVASQTTIRLGGGVG